MPRSMLILLLVALAAPACMAQDGLKDLVGSWQGACAFAAATLDGSSDAACIDGVIAQPYYVQISLNPDGGLIGSWQTEDATKQDRNEDLQYSCEATTVNNVALTPQSSAQFNYSEDICVTASNGNSFIWRLEQLTSKNGSKRLMLIETGTTLDGSLFIKHCPETTEGELTCNSTTGFYAYECMLTKVPSKP